MNESDDLTPQELCVELLLLQVGQTARIKRTGPETWTIKFGFGEFMNAKQRRAYEFDRFWIP